MSFVSRGIPRQLPKRCGDGEDGIEMPTASQASHALSFVLQQEIAVCDVFKISDHIVRSDLREVADVT